jgi:hypothetical protein
MVFGHRLESSHNLVLPGKDLVIISCKLYARDLIKAILILSLFVFVVHLYIGANVGKSISE